MAVLILQVPSTFMETASEDPNSAEAMAILDLQAASEYFHETGELTFILPSEGGYGTIYEGEGVIKEFRIESSDQ